MRPNAGWNSCPGLGWSRVRYFLSLTHFFTCRWWNDQPSRVPELSPATQPRRSPTAPNRVNPGRWRKLVCVSIILYHPKVGQLVPYISRYRTHNTVQRTICGGVIPLHTSRLSHQNSPPSFLTCILLDDRSFDFIQMFAVSVNETRWTLLLWPLKTVLLW